MLPVAVLLLGYAVALSVAAARVVRAVPLVEQLDPPEPARWPRVSVVIPACNEEATLGTALASRLGEGYPNAEYVVVDDRSTDATGAIVDELAAHDPRVVPIHVEHLPEGWLGKVHALHVGVTRSAGEWILFSDADVHHEPGTLARIVAYAEARGLDHVAVVPTIWSSTFWLDVLMNTFLRFIVIASRAWTLEDPRSRASVGGGVFSLVRRAALERAGGLAPLALEVADDAALGQRLKWSGARQALLGARGFVGLHYYRSLPEAIRGMEKNGFASMGYSVARALLFACVLAFAELGPLFVVAFGSGPSRLVATAALILLVATQLFACRWMRRPLVPAIFAPLGIALLVFGTMRSMLLTLARGGVCWRGTRYPLEALRRGRCFVPT